MFKIRWGKLTLVDASATPIRPTRQCYIGPVRHRLRLWADCELFLYQRIIGVTMFILLFGKYSKSFIWCYSIASSRARIVKIFDGFQFNRMRKSTDYTFWITDTKGRTRELLVMIRMVTPMSNMHDGYYGCWHCMWANRHVYVLISLKLDISNRQ